MKLKMFRDKKGYPHADAEKSHRLVALFLESEIQSDKIYGYEIIEKINKAKSDENIFFEEIGNSNSLTLNSGRAVIKNEITSQTCDISLDDLQKSVLEWIVFLDE